MRKRRVLILGSHKRWRMERGVELALRRAGHETLLVDDRRAARLVGRAATQRWTLWNARRFQPDLVFLSKCLGLELETIAAVTKGRDSVMWYMDGPWYAGAERPGERHIAAVARMADVMFCNGWDESWREQGANAKYLPAAGDLALVPVRPDPRFAAEVAFTGTGYDEGRAQFLAEIAKRHDLKVWGTSWEKWKDAVNWTGRPVEGRDFARVCSSTAIMLGALPAPMKTATTSASNRMWITILSGGFYLGAHSPGVARLLRDREHCVWYDGLDDCLARIAEYLRAPAERERIRKAGDAFVRRHHTFDQRIENLLTGEEWRNPLGD